MDSLTVILLILGFALEVLVVVSGAVWVVGKINGTTERLGDKIETMGGSISGLNVTLDRVGTVVSDHAGRIMVLESKRNRSG